MFAAGLTSLILGIIGIVIPLLPTTPFLLLSAACFLRSSGRLYRWITGHRIFGRYIRNYLKYHAVTLKSKVIALILLWAVILISLFHFQVLWLRVLLSAVLFGVSLHLLLMRTLTPEMIEAEEERENT